MVSYISVFLHVYELLYAQERCVNTLFCLTVYSVLFS